MKKDIEREIENRDIHSEIKNWRNRKLRCGDYRTQRDKQRDDKTSAPMSVKLNPLYGKPMNLPTDRPGHWEDSLPIKIRMIIGRERVKNREKQVLRDEH